MEKNKRGGLWTFEEIVAFGFDKIIGNSKVIENFANTVYHHEQNSLEIYVQKMLMTAYMHLGIYFYYYH